MAIGIASNRIAAAAALLCLAACGTVGQVAPPRAVLDFGPPVAPLPGPGWPQLGLEVRAPAWFDSLGIEYRLAYADPTRLNDYAQSRWAGPPAQLVAQRLRQRMSLAQGQGGCRLQIRLDEFSQIFESPATSRGVLRGNASLTDRRGAVLGQIALDAGVPATTADAAGGVGALVEATDLTAHRLADWLAEPTRQDALKHCGG